ncbi:Sjogren's syndrome/scleroderma autoantigen 1 family protein [Tardisphaera miroshnichenkoae]
MVNDEDIKRMANLLKSGATMLADTCPVCGSPLFKLRDGQVICPHCNKPVVFVKAGQQEASAMEPYIIERVKEVLLKRLSEVSAALDADSDNMSSYVSLISTILDSLKKIKELEAS